MLDIFIKGLLVGLSLCVAIGPQNAFVLKQGLQKKHILWVCLVCASSDALLISFGVYGFAGFIQKHPFLLQIAQYAGALFLTVYGLQHAKQAMAGQQSMQLHAADDPSQLRNILLACLAFTWLNPHVYLDTVVLIGSISSQYAQQKQAFAAGAMTASWLFFFSLGYGARLLLPLFQNPKAWQVLDGVIALVMWSIACSLILSA